MVHIDQGKEQCRYRLKTREHQYSFRTRKIAQCLVRMFESHGTRGVGRMLTVWLGSVSSCAIAWSRASSILSINLPTCMIYRP